MPILTVLRSWIRALEDWTTFARQKKSSCWVPRFKNRFERVESSRRTVLTSPKVWTFPLWRKRKPPPAWSKWGARATWVGKRSASTTKSQSFMKTQKMANWVRTAARRQHMTKKQTMKMIWMELVIERNLLREVNEPLRCKIRFRTDLVIRASTEWCTCKRWSTRTRHCGRNSRSGSTRSCRLSLALKTRTSS